MCEDFECRALAAFIDIQGGSHLALEGDVGLEGELGRTSHSLVQLARSLLLSLDSVYLGACIPLPVFC